MEWIAANPELATALLGPLLIAIGYFYRMRIERRQNLQEALYLLLEIWHRVSTLTSRSLDTLIEDFAEQLKARYPNAVMTPGELQATKAHCLPILRQTLRSHALGDLEGLQTAYLRVISLVARTHPIYAYQLESASSTKKRLAFVDNYLDDAYRPLDQQGGIASRYAAALRERFSAHAERDAAKEMERSLRWLAWRLGPMTLMSVHLLVAKRHKHLRSGAADEVRLLFDEILPPILADLSLAEAHCRHGVEELPSSNASPAQAAARAPSESA